MQKGLQKYPCVRFLMWFKAESYFGGLFQKISLLFLSVWNLLKKYNHQNEKIRFIMRCSFLLLAFQCTLITLLFASNGMGQDLTRKIDLQLQNSSVKESLLAIQSKTDIQFSLNDKTLAGVRKDVSFSVSQASVQSVINRILDGTGLGYKLVNGFVAIYSIPKPPPPPPPGSIKGRIVEFETSQPLPGASVYIVELQKGITTDLNGYYTLVNIPPGKYTLKITYVGFKTENVSVEVKEGKESSYDVKLQGDNKLSEVVVSGTRKTRAPVAHTSERQLVEELKGAQSVVSGISSEQISKSADRNAAEVVRKIAGVTVRDDKFIVIRGLNERYNMTYLNGNTAPSTELYSRAFSLDLIPSRIIDRILVYKSPAPDLQADMTGGAVKIFTKDARSVQHLDIEVQTGYRSGTTFNNNFLTYKGGSTDWLGFDDGTRKLPVGLPGYGDFTKATLSQKQYAENFTPYLQYGHKMGSPLLQLTANYYNTFKLVDHSVSTLTSLSYKNESQQLDVGRLQSSTNSSTARSHQLINDGQSTQVAQLTMLQNFTYRLRDSSNIQFKNFVLQQGQTGTIVRNTATNVYHYGDKWLQDTSDPFYPKYRDIILSYTQRLLYSGNLTGTHYWGQGKQLLQWNGGYTYSHQSIPDQRIIHLQQKMYGSVLGGDNDLNWVAVGRPETLGTIDNTGNNNLERGMLSRTWTQNNESVYNGSIDYTWKLKSWVTIKAGTYQSWKQRVLFRRVYTVNEGDLNNNGYPDYIGPVGGNGQYIDYNLVFFKQQDLGKVWSNNYLRDDGSGLKVFDRTSGADAYKASEQNNSGYAAISLLPFNGKLDIYGGLRVEHDRQLVAGAIAPTNTIGGVNTPMFVDIQKTDWLPSINVGYRPNKSIVVRAAYGKTVNRPEFRELSPYIELDYANNQNIVGNPTLKPANIDNYDARLEWYPKQGSKGESISFGAFYKDLKNPIERFIYRDLFYTSPAMISFLNADKATVKGLELDIRKNLDFIPIGFFKDLSIIANGTYIQSRATRAQKDPTSSFLSGDIKIDRQLQGQAPYAVNLGLYYDNAGSGTKLALIFNRVGPRIYAASIGQAAADSSVHGGQLSGYTGSLIELARTQMDFSLTQRLVKSLQMKLSIQNLLNQPIRMAEDENFTYKYEQAQFIPASPGKNSSSKPQDIIKNDPIASEYRTDRYFIFSFTYSF